MIKNVLAIIVDFNTSDESNLLAEQLLSSPHNKGFALSVVVVDNGGSKRYEPSEKALKLGVKVQKVEKNDGYAAGCVAGISAGAGYDAYCFLNSDLEVEPDTLAKLVKVLDDNHHVAAVGPRVFKGRTKKVWGARGTLNLVLGTTAMCDVKKSGELPRWSYIPGCSLLVRRSAYEEVGGFPLEYRMYYEETELCVRLQKAGWDLWVEAGASAYHSVKSMEKGIPARHYAYYFTRNNLYFWSKNFQVPWPVQFPRMGFIVAKELLVPLRRARSFHDLEDRLKYIGAGVVDAVPFLSGKTYFDRKLFPR